MRVHWLVAAVAAVGLFVAACGDDDDSEPDATPEDAAPAEETRTGGETGVGSPGEGSPDETPVPTEPPDPGEPAEFQAEIPEGWYVFAVHPEYVDDRKGLDDAALAASQTSGIPNTIILLQADPLLSGPIDGGALLFMDPEHEVALPVISLSWCTDPATAPVNAADFLASLPDGYTGEAAGSLTRDGQEYAIARFSEALRPELAQHRTWVEDDGCWIESTLISISAEEPPIDAWTSFLATVDAQPDE